MEKIIKMRYLEKIPAECYLKYSFIQYKYGLINIFEYTERIITLKNLIDPSNTLNRLLNTLINTQCEKHTDLNIFEDNKYFKSEIFISQKFNNNSGFQNDNDFYKFIINTSSQGYKWNFIKGDPDFFPSIPHGHSKKNKTVKLDSYLGYIYTTSKTNSNKELNVGREDREFIIKLWNNNKFRRFAIDTINFYLHKYPKFNWRVPKEKIKILPRKRKLR